MAGRPPESIAHRGYEHARRVYAAMAERSVPVAGEGERAGRRLFRGSLIALCADLGYTSSSQYAQIRNDLAAMGCIEQERRGSSVRPSLWLLKRAPTAELWHEFIPSRPFTRRLEATHRETHQQLLRAALGRLPTTRPEVAQQLREAGVKTTTGAITWLASNLSEKQLRSLGPGMCLAYAVERTPVAVPHTCGVEGLDDLVPSNAAGSWKRRADALERLETG
jgi:hypothetical protein